MIGTINGRCLENDVIVGQMWNGPAGQPVPIEQAGETPTPQLDSLFFGYP
jgi:hypothetical protein